MRGKARPNPSPIFLLGDLQTGKRLTGGAGGQPLTPPPQKKPTEVCQLISSWAITMHPGVTFFQFSRIFKSLQNIAKFLKIFPNFIKQFQISQKISKFFIISHKFFLFFYNFSNAFSIFKIFKIFLAPPIWPNFLKFFLRKISCI